MRQDTAVEIGVVGVIGLALLWLWSRNHAAGAGTGLDAALDLPAISEGQTASGVPLSLAVPGLPPATTFGPLADQPITITGNTYEYGAGQAAACGCSDVNANSYGSNTDLAAALANAGYDFPMVDQSGVY